ncbi:hypothetical protein M0804_004273 [Polistes exclamans]|nr:hypothetical protein M0804_004273 [Polistes exclamans]
MGKMKGVSVCSTEREVWYEGARRAIEARIRAATNSNGAGPGTGGGNTPPSAVARGVVLFVGDGMGMSTLTAARILSGQRHGNTGEEAQLAWDSFPAVALSRVYYLNFEFYVVEEKQRYDSSTDSWSRTTLVGATMLFSKICTRSFLSYSFTISSRFSLGNSFPLRLGNRGTEREKGKEREQIELSSPTVFPGERITIHQRSAYYPEGCN